MFHRLSPVAVATALILPLLAPGLASAATTAYSTPGDYSFTVPVGVTSIQATVTGGAGGGGLCAIAADPGGRGTTVTATLDVTPGEVLSVQAAGSGGCGSAGFGGGGGPGTSNVFGGGGASFVGSSLNQPLLLGAGGGGGGIACCGGFGEGGDAGATTGSAGTWNAGDGGAGGTEGAGGAGGAGAGGALDGAPGAFLTGGDGGSGSGGIGGGGGGGAGALYYGGGGGGSSAYNFAAGGGGGGSSYVSVGASAVTGPTVTSAAPGVSLVFQASARLSASGPSSATVGAPMSSSSISAGLSAGSSPSGTVTFVVFGPQSTAPTSCASGGTTVGTASVSGNGAYNPSVGFTPSAAGDYWWYASYGGDSDNDAASSTCGASMAGAVVGAEKTPSPPTISVSSPLDGQDFTPTALPATTTSTPCPRPTGRIAARALGPVALGMTRAQARTRLPHFNVTQNDFDNFCLTGRWGIRAGYPSAQLLRSTPGPTRAAVDGRIVLALTSNRHYQLDGIRPGATQRAASTTLHTGAVMHVGLNDWYMAADGHDVVVIKVRGGTVREIGIASPTLTRTPSAQLELLKSFHL